MDQTTSNTVRIDGDRIKAIRLQKGLTQLYLASYVGVTTDTISRWENKKIPSIKRENALRLAEALEVPLDEIMEGKGPSGEGPKEADGVPEHQSPSPAAGGEESKEEKGKEAELPEQKRKEEAADTSSKGAKKGSRISPWLFIVIGIILAGSGLFLKLLVPEQKIEPDDIELTRLLPAHARAGSVIPVLLELDSFAPEGISMIITETIPRGGTPVSAKPPFKKFQQKSHSLKWILKTSDDDALLAYLIRLPKRDGRDGRLRFSGRIRVKLGLDSLEKEIGGSRFIALEACHWADENCDHVIDDEEILAVYDRYGEIEIFDPVLRQVEEIWTEGGYRIDEKSGSIRPAPHESSASSQDSDKEQ